MSLSPITSERRLRRFLTYDFEWIREGGEEGKPVVMIAGRTPLKLRVCGVFDGERYRCYSTVRDFLRGELTRKNAGAWFYGHYAGISDLVFVLKELADDPRYSVEGSFAGGSSLVIMTIRELSSRRAWHFVDSGWLLKVGLRKIGKWIGTEKGGEDGGIDIFYGPFEILRKYNEGDVRILWEAINRFESLILELGGQLQMTLASCGMNLFRRRFLKRTINTSDLVNDLSRNAYFASRVEIFKGTIEDGYYYDINSSFPFAMLEPLPASLHATVSRIRDTTFEKPFIADVEITVPKCYLPPLPYRSPKGGVFFPTGSWRGWYSSVDLKLLIEEGGRIEKVHRCMEFDAFTDLSDYAKTLYQLRLEDPDGFMGQVIKLLLNSLYGKFAETSEKVGMLLNPAKTTCPHFEPGMKGAKHADNSCLEMLFPGAWMVTDEVEVKHCHTPLSVFITAIARRNLFKWLKMAGDIYYTDTDSIITTSELPVSPGLGGLKLESRIKSGEFLAPKVYRRDDVVRAKGFSGGATAEEMLAFRERGEVPDDKRMTVKRFMALKRGETLYVERMRRIRELARRGGIEAVEDIFPKRLTGKAKPKRVYSRGDSRPWDIDELRASGF